MIDVALSNLAPLIDGDQEWIRDHLKAAEAINSGYCGGYYNGGLTAYQNDPTNTGYEFQSSWLADVIAGHPGCLVKCDNTSHPLGDIVADLMTGTLNRWARITRVVGPASRIALGQTAAIGFGAVWMEPRPDPHKLQPDGELLWPAFHDYEPDDALWDTSARSWELGEYAGHVVLSSRRALREEGGWNNDWLLTAHEIRQEDAAEISEKRLREYRWRDMIRYRVLWVKHATTAQIMELGYKRSDYEDEYGDELDGPHHHGWLLYVGDKGTPKMARRPEPFIGPEIGPYFMASGLPVQGSSMPLAHLVATHSQAVALNNYERAVNRKAEMAKDVVAVNGRADDLQAQIQDVEDLGFINVDGLVDADGHPLWALWNFNTVGPEHFANLERMRESYERASGRPDALQGRTSGDTAREVTIAASSAERRRGFQTWKFHDAMAQAFTIAAHYMYYRRNFSIVMENGDVFDGGDDVPGLAFEDFRIEYDARAGAFETQADKFQKAEIVRQAIAEGSAVMPMEPWRKWDEYWETLGELYNIPEMERLFDYKIASQAAQMVAQIQMAAAEPQGRMNSPTAKPRGGTQNGGLGALPRGGIQRAPQAEGRGAMAMAGAGKGADKPKTNGMSTASKPRMGNASNRS